MTCHNRKEKTLSCLASLFNIDHRNSAKNSISIQCYLVDDGCTDGTAEAVSCKYPKVQIIQGDGTLYWNQGMRLAWITALKEEFSFYLWLNDDVRLYQSTIEKLIETYQDISARTIKIGALVGTLQDSNTSLPSYGGRVFENPLFPLQYGKIISPQKQPIQCNYINGNCTLISAQSVDAIGILSKEFSHSMGDFDYGLRLAKCGFSCWVAPFYVGTCPNNNYKAIFKNTEQSLKQRVKLISKPTVLPPPDEWMVYVKRHAGVFWPLYYAKAWLRKKLPTLWVINWH
jgi:GT2 family glycosyltransferase